MLTRAKMWIQAGFSLGCVLRKCRQPLLYSECYPNPVTWSLVKAGEIDGTGPFSLSLVELGDFSGDFENPKVWPSIALTSAQGQKSYCF